MARKMLSNVVLVVVKIARYVFAQFNALKVFKDLKAEGQITFGYWWVLPPSPEAKTASATETALAIETA